MTAIDFSAAGGLAAHELNVELNARVERATAAAARLPRDYLAHQSSAANARARFNTTGGASPNCPLGCNESSTAATPTKRWRTRI